MCYCLLSKSTFYINEFIDCYNIKINYLEQLVNIQALFCYHQDH